MFAAPRSSTKNRILGRLTDEEYLRLAPHLEAVQLILGRTIHPANEPISHIYFPENSMISLVSNMSNGSTVEVGVVGREGAAGIHALLGAESSQNESMVQIADGAVRIKKDVLRAEFKRGGGLHDLLLRYMHALWIQTSQTAACNRLHSVEERLSRWMLMCHDRAPSDNLPLTHEFLAMMLGTRRAGVTGAALSLQAEGFVNYRRGNVTILDRGGLENFTCECYQIVKAEFDSLESYVQQEALISAG